MTTDHPVDLTAQQLSVVKQPWDARTLVTAGAGAGKTTTLTHRLEYLTSQEGLNAVEVLVLSFSRAAVRELRERVDHLATRARLVRAQTFDGWAAALLRQTGTPRDDLLGISFDGRIDLATQAIEGGLVEQLEAGVPSHIVIDEVQDLVGVRREMVEALLDRFSDGCGFTVVGDMAQSIYGFQMRDAEARLQETNRFFDWVRRSFPDDLIEIVLSENFRAKTPEARLALPYGHRLQRLPSDRIGADREGGAIYAELRSTLLSVPDFGSLDDRFAVDSLRSFDGTTAMLCRENGQVLDLSEALNSHNVPHRIQRSTRERPAPAWIAELFLATGAADISEDRFGEITSNLMTPIGADVSRTWRALRRVAAAPRNQLSLLSLREAVADGRVPDELCAPPQHKLILSSAHRAKGLEFDRVVVIDPGELRPPGPDSDPTAEARLLYVAMTRARCDMYRMSRRRPWFLRRGDHLWRPVDRWYGSGRERWMRSALESTERDVSHVRPAYSREIADAAEVQRYLLTSVRSGDEIEVRKLHDLPMSDVEAPEYGIFHGTQQIGDTSVRFRADLWRVLKRGPTFEIRDWPDRVTGLRIDCLETVVGHPGVTEQLHMGDSGVWLAPRLSGLGRLVWPDNASSRKPEDH